ncbi:MAG: phosphotransferase [Dehalococcoidia bacterium]
MNSVGGARDYVRREVLWEWPLSRVERVHLDRGKSLVVKRSRRPMIDEGRILRHLGRSNIPLPKLYLSWGRDGILTMVLEDLGPAVREATFQEAASAAVRTHAASPPPRLQVLDAGALAGLPSRTLEALDRLERAGRWQDAAGVRSTLLRLEPVAERLSEGAELPPFGLCHSEFHPLSLHIGSKRIGLVDWARAFVGPGLLDLASYSGTVLTPDPAACRALIEGYVAEGGAPEARAPRAGLPAERWALLWHRVWTAEWFASSCATWMTDTGKDAEYQVTVLRHLEEALDLAGAD